MMNLLDYINCLRRRVEELEKLHTDAKVKTMIEEYATTLSVLYTVIDDLEFLDKRTYWDIDGVTFINAELKKESV